MADVNVKWTGGVQFMASDQAGHVVVTDRDGQGMKPPLLLLVSLAGCAGVDVVRILEKKRQRFTSIEANVSKHNDPDPPWCITKIETEWIVRGHNLKEKAVRDAAGRDGRLSKNEAKKIAQRSDALALWGDNAVNYLDKTGQKTVSVDKLIGAGYRYAAFHAANRVEVPMLTSISVGRVCIS